MMTLEEQNKVLQNIIASVLCDNAEDDWVEVNIRFSCLVSVSSARVQKTKNDGSAESVSIPDQAAVLYNKLRAGMYQRGKGTWYNAWTTIEPTGASETEFEYDVPPVYPMEVSPRSFYEDIRYFPRFVDNIPPWLMEKLKEAKLAERNAAE